ncbi:MAG TPA: hypothetical protein ENN40_03260 [Candidatus Aminicenantes bacterium]|nr:hypothetical protein [Candidatus Aminicenantes bacterium]
MNEYKIINNYLLFKQKFTDTSGVSFRGADIQENKPGEHKLITDVHPFFTEDEATWKRIALLLEGVKKSNITHLYSPDRIVRSRDNTLLIFPYLKGRTLEQVMDDSQKRDVPVNFDLAFSIVMAIADQLDVGSTIVVSGKKSFHGFLTPDNIIVDFDGNIFLKNYGIAPFLEQNEKVYREIEMKYGAWLAPEFLRKEKISASSDIYHLGYIIYRMLTGKYFSQTAGEDFDSKFSNLSFSHFMPTTSKDYITHLINFFKKTLNPDPMKRFNNIREFKDYIANYFEIEELSSVTFNLSYFMNSLYARDMQEEEREMARELEYVIPEPEPEEAAAAESGGSSEIVEQILSGLDDSDRSRSKWLLPVIIGALLVAVGLGFYFISQANKAKVETQQVQASLKQELESYKKQLDQEFETKMKAIEQRTAETAEEKKAQEEEIRKAREQREELLRRERERLAKIEQEEEAEEAEAEKKRLEAEQAKRAEQAKIDEAAEAKRREEEAARKLEESINAKIAAGEPLEMKYVTTPPRKTGGDDPYSSRTLRKLFKDRSVTVTSEILVDEKGTVSRVRFKGDVEAEAKLELSQILASWSFSPARRGATPVKVWMEVPLKFE